MRKFLGIICCLTGALLVFGAIYIQNEVRKGKAQIAQAETAKDTAQSILSKQKKAVQKYSRKATDYVEKKITEGKKEATFYAYASYAISALGILLLLIGIYHLMRKKTA